MGAQPLAISSLVVGHALRLLLAGLIVGGMLSAVVARLLRAAAFGVGSGDPAVLLGVAILLAAVVLAACYAPARRAGRVDPMDLIRM